MDNNLGYYLGDVCNRNGCKGVIKDNDEYGCYCSATSMPPCSHCEKSNERQYCPECYWSGAEEQLAEVAPVKNGGLAADVIQKAVAQSVLWNSKFPIRRTITEVSTLEHNESYSIMHTGEILVGNMYHFYFHDILTQECSFEEKLDMAFKYARNEKNKKNMKDVDAIGDDLLDRWNWIPERTFNQHFEMVQELGKFVDPNIFLDKYRQPIPPQAGSVLMVNRKFEHLLTGM